MSQTKVDYPSLVMVFALTVNMVVGFYDPYKVNVPKEIGQVVFILGFLLCAYVANHLRRGFLGETEPNLGHLVTTGPYRSPDIRSTLVSWCSSWG